MDANSQDATGPARAGSALDAARSATAAMFDGYDAPEGVTWGPADDVAPGAYSASPPGASDDLIVHVHGGGFTLGSPAFYGGMLGRVAAATGTRVVSCAYRLAPEHPFPAGLDDVTDALERLSAHGGRFAVIGDSAGGNLAIGALRRLHERCGRQATALVLFSPLVQMDPASPSYADNAESDVMFSVSSLEGLRRAYLGNRNPRIPAASPIYADLSALPATLLFVSADEVLRDEGIAFAERLRTLGVACDLRVVAGQPHSWPAFRQDRPAIAAVGAASEFIREAFLGPPEATARGKGQARAHDSAARG